MLRWAIPFPPGVGARVQTSDVPNAGDCLRFDHSYSYRVLNVTQQRQPTAAPSFDYLACSGAKIPDALGQVLVFLLSQNGNGQIS
jgi:hypothetical protein